MTSKLKKHYRVCNLCEAMCGLEILHDGKKVHKVIGDKKDPLSKGSICPKGAVIHHLHEDPNRLKSPIQQVSPGNWEPITWNKAFDIIEEKINNIRKTYGDNAVGIYLGNPTVHNFGMMMMVGELKRVLGSKNVFSPTSMDQLPHHFMGYYMFGHPLKIPIPDIDHTDYLIILGANPIVSNGSMLSAPGIQKRMQNIQKRQGKIIQFDPIKNETSRVVDEHYFITPNTDVYLLLGMLHLIIKNNWIQLKHLKEHITDITPLKSIATSFTLSKIAEITGIEEESIQKIAHQFATTPKAVIYGRMGVSTQSHGGLCHWLIQVLHILTGHFDTEGGAMFTNPALDIIRSKTHKKSHARWFSRVSKAPEFDGELPVSVFAEELVTPGEGQIKGLITYAGNPALSTPNAKRLDKGLADLDFMVSIDIYLNETTKHAHIILPPPSHLEIDHYDVIFNLLAVTNNTKFSSALFTPQKEQQYDWQIAQELTKRFAKTSVKKPSKIMQWFTPKQLLNIGLLTGPYGKLSHPSRIFSGISLKKVINSKHGISLGKLQSNIPKTIVTKDKKIQITPKVFLDQLKTVQSSFEELNTSTLFNKNNFLLIGRRHLRTNNSWMHNIESLSKGKNKCTALMHPENALALQLTTNDTIKVISNTGSIEIPVEVSPKIMKGVLSIPHGFGHLKKGTLLDIANKKEIAGVSVNDITDHKRIDTITGNAAFSGQPIQVTKI